MTNSTDLSILSLKLAAVGGGAMGSALLRGILHAQLHTPQVVGVSDPDQQRGTDLADELDIHYLSDNTVAAQAETVLLAIKPQIFPVVSEQLRPHLTAKLVISILAGTSISQLESAFPGVAIVRAMPNTPALVGEGMTALSYGARVTDSDRNEAIALFEAVGRVISVPESQMDAITALSGSGPGYMSVVVEALSDGGVKAGLPRTISTELAVQTMLGSARLLQQENLHPAILKDRVTSPGGTTIAGIAELERHCLRAALIDAVQAAKQRSEELRAN
ncbi:MAG: pyrroline-5-carboxylate reductase [Cyanobacteria bacterium P01_E01_bin.34]